MSIETTCDFCRTPITDYIAYAVSLVDPRMPWHDGQRPTRFHLHALCVAPWAVDYFRQRVEDGAVDFRPLGTAVAYPVPHPIVVKFDGVFLQCKVCRCPVVSPLPAGMWIEVAESHPDGGLKLRPHRPDCNAMYAQALSHVSDVELHHKRPDGGDTS